MVLGPFDTAPRDDERECVVERPHIKPVRIVAGARPASI